MKKYTQSPLPFQGQKRRFIKHFEKALNNYPSDAIYVDLFGGSGLLSHSIKRKYPNATVIYNDFDNYRERINNINNTNIILQKLRNILYDYPRSKRIIGKHRDNVINVLKQANKKGFVDWITLSASLKFSMSYSTDLKGFIKDSLYNRVRCSDYNATDYLKGVEIVRYDYKELFGKYKNINNVVYLVDPPYLSTDTSTYNNKEYWRLQDYLEVLQVLQNHNYFYFTSNKSQIVELCEWISTLSTTENPFKNANCTKIATNTTHNAKYVDIMYHIKKSDNE